MHDLEILEVRARALRDQWEATLANEGDRPLQAFEVHEMATLIVDCMAALARLENE